MSMIPTQIRQDGQRAQNIEIAGYLDECNDDYYNDGLSWRTEFIIVLCVVFVGLIRKSHEHTVLHHNIIIICVYETPHIIRTIKQLQ